ncbi:ABC transporter permease [Fusibacter sp. JL216-2]|uniref:ABC transporter permease n=1 Tax=Fusibacter sp. JL216-2 TaxID=3071453 RepID=UPI003D3300AF
MLFRKMMRDIWNQKGTYMACVTIMVIGLMTFNLFSIGYDNFSQSREIYYDNMNFADGFASVKGMPISELKAIEGLDEIRKVQGRLVKDVRIIEGGDSSNAYLRLISFKPSAQDDLNQFQLQSGQLPGRGQNEMILDSKYYNATQRHQGDKISLAVQGQVVDLSVSGSGRSPEYIYALRTDQDLYPDPEKFGVAFVPYDTMKSILRAGQSVNDISFMVEKNYTYKDAEHALREKIESYGLLDIRARKDQKSNLLLKSEIDGMKGMALAMPVVFMGVAAMIMVIMLKRLVEKQRGQIGVFKAFGLTDFQILFHYIGYALVIGGLAGVIGSILGNVLVIPFTKMYQTMFNMPLIMPDFSLKYGLLSLILAVAFSMFAGYQGVRKILEIEPAEAMRPPAPASAKEGVIEQMHFLWKRLTMISRIAIRNMFRNKGRTGFVFIGIVLTYAILGLPYALKENMDIMIYDQFETVMVYDMKVDLERPVKQQEAVAEIMQTAKVEYAEPLMEVPAVFYHTGYKKEVSLLGIQEDSRLYKLYDKAGRQQTLSKDGVILSQQLADKLHVSVGQDILLKSSYARRPKDTVPVKVMKIIPQYLGLNAYMDQGTLSHLLDQPQFATSVIGKTDLEGVHEVRDRYNESSMVFGVNGSQELMDKYSEMMEMMGSMLGMFVVIGVLCGFSIVYASSMIALSERKRELASMLVIGLSYKEVKRVLYLEQWYTAVLAFLLGMPVLKLMVEGMSSMMANDVYTMPTKVSLLSFLTAAVLTLASIILAQWRLGKKVEKIKLVESLSIKE